MKVVHMTNTDPSFSPLEHSDQFRAQLENLEKLGHAQGGAPCDLTEFDEETERLYDKRSEMPMNVLKPMVWRRRQKRS